MTRLIACAGAAALLSLASGCGGTDRPDTAVAEVGPGPEEVVADFLDARIADDCEAYRAYYTPELAEDSACYQAPLVRQGEYPRVEGADTDADRSSVETTDLFECTGPGAGDPVEETVTYVLVRTDGEWLIDEVDLEGVTDDDCLLHNGS